MKKQKLFFLLAFITSLFFACNSSNSEGNAEEAPAEEATEEVAEEPATPSSPSVSLVITSQVTDFGKWKAAFDSHKDIRRGAQLEDWAILQEKDKPNSVTVILKVEDEAAAQEFIASEDLKVRMKEAGVTGEPQIVFYDMQYYNAEAAKSSSVRAMVSHTVQDYSAWKMKFDEHQGKQAEAGVSTVAVACKRGNQNEVTVVATAADFETLQKFLNSADLKEAMAGAGVIGEPTILLATLVTPVI